MPLFSIIIATYNRAHLICAAIESVFQQRCSDYEILVIDDGSTDDTARILEVYGDRIRYFRQANQGPCRARNWGMRKARGEYVTILDSDDELVPWSLDTYRKVIEQFDRPTLIRGGMTKFHDGDGAGKLLETPLKAQDWQDYLSSAQARYPVAIPAAIKREALLEAGGFADGNICSEEHDLYLRLGLEQGFVMIDSPHVYAYRQHVETQSRDTGPLYRGARLLLSRERKGSYPGGKARRSERALFIARSLQYSFRRCLEFGDPLQAIELYVRALPQYLRSGQREQALRDGRIAVRQLKAALKTRVSGARSS
jgi:glycosyltransferase involved in cell wall biosynthesis